MTQLEISAAEGSVSPLNGIGCKLLVENRCNYDGRECPHAKSGLGGITCNKAALHRLGEYLQEVGKEIADGTRKY